MSQNPSALLGQNSIAEPRDRLGLGALMCVAAGLPFIGLNVLQARAALG
jgi:hypothetical protein